MLLFTGYTSNRRGRQHSQPDCVHDALQHASVLNKRRLAASSELRSSTRDVCGRCAALGSALGSPTVTPGRRAGALRQCPCYLLHGIMLIPSAAPADTAALRRLATPSPPSSASTGAGPPPSATPTPVATPTAAPSAGQDSDSPAVAFQVCINSA